MSDLPEGFQPEEAPIPEGFLADEDVLRAGIEIPQQVTSRLTRTLEAGAPGSEMGREQASLARSANPLGLSFPGLGPAPATQAPLVGPESLTEPFIKIPSVSSTDPRFQAFLTGATGQVPTEETASSAAAALNVAKSLPEFAETGVGVLTGPLGYAEPAAAKLIGAGFAGQMIPEVPEAARQAGRLSVEGTPQERKEAYLGLGSNIVLPALLGAPALEEAGRALRRAPAPAPVPPGARVTRPAQVSEVRTVEPPAPPVTPSPTVQPLPAETGAPAPLAEFADKPAGEWFTFGQDVQKQSMAGKGPSLQIIAEQTALKVPDEAAWQAEADKVKAEQKALFEELAKDPSQMMKRQNEIMGLGAKGQFFSEGLKIIRKQKAPEPAAAAAATTTPAAAPAPTGEITVEEFPDGLKVSGLRIAPAERGKGAGTAKMQEVLDRAKASGKPVFLTAHAETVKDQPRLNAFYERLGFKQYSTDPLSGKPMYRWDPPAAPTYTGVDATVIAGKPLGEWFKAKVAADLPATAREELRQKIGAKSSKPSEILKRLKDQTRVRGVVSDLAKPLLKPEEAIPAPAAAQLAEALEKGIQRLQEEAGLTEDQARQLMSSNDPRALLKKWGEERGTFLSESELNAASKLINSLKAPDISPTGLAILGSLKPSGLPQGTPVLPEKARARLQGRVRRAVQEGVLAKPISSSEIEGLPKGALFQGVRPENVTGQQGKSSWLTDDLNLAGQFKSRTGEVGIGRIDVYDPKDLPPLEDMLEQERSKPGSNVYSYANLSKIKPIGTIEMVAGKPVFRPTPTPAPAAAPAVKLSESDMRDLVSDLTQLSRRSDLDVEERANVARAIEAARMGNPAEGLALRDRLKELAVPKTKLVKGIKFGGTGERIPDLIDWLKDAFPSGVKITSKSDYGRLVDEATGAAREVLFKNKGASVDTVMKAAELEGMHFASQDDFINAVLKAGSGRTETGARLSAEERMLQEEAAQVEEFQATALRNRGRTPAEKKAAKPFAVENLKQGDIFWIKGEQFKVREVTPEGDVITDDGKRFGQQQLRDGQTIYPDKGEVIETSEEGPGPIGMGGALEGEIQPTGPRGEPLQPQGTSETAKEKSNALRGIPTGGEGKSRWEKVATPENEPLYRSADGRFELSALYLGRRTVQGWKIRDNTLGITQDFPASTLETVKSIADGWRVKPPLSPEESLAKIKVSEWRSESLAKSNLRKLNASTQSGNDYEIYKTERGTFAIRLKTEPPVSQGPIGMGGAAEGEIKPTGPRGEELPTYGVAARVLEKQRQAGTIIPVEPGEGVSPEEQIQRGRDLLAAGADAESIMSEMERTKKFNADEAAILRAHGEILDQAFFAASDKFGPNSPVAEKALEDYSAWQKRFKNLSTEWHRTGQTLQGETEIDTGTFHGLRKAWIDATGKDFTPEQAQEAKKKAKAVKDATEEADKAKADTLAEVGKSAATETGKRPAAPKPGEVAVPDAPTIWKRAKELLDAGEDDFDSLRHKLAQEFGIPVEEVYRKLTEPKAVRTISDEMYRKMANRRRLVNDAKDWLRNEQSPGWLQFIRKVPRVFFTAKILGHGTVGMITHAGLNIFNPGAWRTYWPNFFRQYRLIASKAYHERLMQDLLRDPLFTKARRAGLANDPFRVSDDYQNPTFVKWLDRIGLTGGRGFDALKTFRQARFNQIWNSLPESLQTPGYAKLLADGINHATGAIRRPFREWANWTFFAPRLEASRWAWMVKDPWDAAKTFVDWEKATPEARAFAMSQLKEKAAIAGTYYGLLMMNQGLLEASGSDQRINFTNPRRGDFLAFKAAGHNIGIVGPMLGMVRLFANLYHAAAGKRGKVESLTPRAAEFGQIAFEYARGKLSPFAGFGTDVISQADFQGRPMPFSSDKTPKYLRRQGLGPYTYTEYALQGFTPIPFSEAVREVWRDQGMGDEQIEAWRKALLVGVAAGLTGARVSAESPPSPTK